MSAPSSIEVTVAALRSRGELVVERTLAQNEARWEGLTEADRERLRQVAKAIVARILREPTVRLRRSDGRCELKIAALNEFFGLDREPEVVVPADRHAGGGDAGRDDPLAGD